MIIPAIGGISIGISIASLGWCVVYTFREQHGEAAILLILWAVFYLIGRCVMKHLGLLSPQQTNS